MIPMSDFNTSYAADDAAWFEKKPNRRYRLRRPRPGEAQAMAACHGKTLAGDSNDHWIIVYQIAPGVRVRRFETLLLPRPTIRRIAKNDQAIEALCESFDQRFIMADVLQQLTGMSL